MKYPLNFKNLSATTAEVKTKYLYVNGVATDTITGYDYRLVDMMTGDVYDITVPTKKDFAPGSKVEVVNPLGSPYKNQHGRVMFSIKADDIHLIKS